MTKAARTKLFLIETMADVFNKKGFSGTSISDVEHITGLSRGAVYSHFANKEEMALAVFDYNFAKVCGLVAQRLKAAYSFYEKVMVFVHVYQTLGSDSVFTGGSPIFNTASEADDTNILLKEKAFRAIMKKERTLADLIRMGMQTGEFRKGIDPEAMATSIISALEGGLMAARLTNDLNRMNNVARTVQALLGGILN